MEFALATVLVVAGIATVVLLPRFLRDVRAVDREWRRRWRALGVTRRRSIMRALRRGEPVCDREHAELALGAVAELERMDRAMRRLWLVHLPASVALILFGLSVGTPVTAIMAALWLALIAASEALNRWRRKRFQRSVELTRDLL
jgi:hypothetical protein